MIKEHNFCGFVEKVNWSPSGTLKKYVRVARGLGPVFWGFFFPFKFISSPSQLQFFLSDTSVSLI